jgi:hypothetical protein
VEQKRVMVPQVYRIAIAAGVVILVAALTVLVMGTLSSGEANAQAKCTLQTLKGTYVFEGRGVLLTQQGGVAAVLPYAEAGILNFDGEGYSEGVFSASLNGETIASQDLYTATYTLESNAALDCVYTQLAPVGDEMLEFHLYTTPQGTNISYFGPGVSGRAVKP